MRCVPPPTLPATKPPVCCLVPQEEREKGYFDDAGNYVEREDKDEAELAQDAWLQSDEGALCGRSSLS